MFCIRLLYTKSPQLLSPISRNFCDVRSLFRFIQCPPVILITRYFSSDNHKIIQTSFTVSYLINSCGLSREAANSASKKVQLLTPERPDYVLALLSKHGFSNFQITKMVKRRPNLLLADPEKTILPKLNFFSSIGMAGPDIANVISSCPLILTCSLRNRIIPVYEFLKCALLFDDDLLIKAMSKPSRNFLQDVESVSAPNLLVLREIGMPQSVIQLILIHYFNLLCCNVDKFSNKIKEVISMGFCPRETKFVHALGVLVQLSESNFQDRIEVYGRLGWSKDDILSAFKKHPNFMKFSEKKIIAAVDFLINVMGMKRSELAAYPYFFSYSLKKRIIPRALVIKILMSKGVMEKNLRFHSVLKLSEKCFSERYVEKHLENIPYLQDVFEGRMCPQELGFQYGL